MPSRSSSAARKIYLEKYFYALESLHAELYAELAKKERRGNYKEALNSFAKKEQEHRNVWKGLLDKQGIPASEFMLSLYFKHLFFHIILTALGPSFATKYLEKDETDALRLYTEMSGNTSLTREEGSVVRAVIKEEKDEEGVLSNALKGYAPQLAYIGSIVFGLNDGLVEVLAAVAGFAVIVSSGLLVVVAGLIVGISGTLSMTGGAYLASKSENLVEGEGKGGTQTSPAKDALYTGVYYLIGALVPVAPFALGTTGYFGIAVAVILVVIVLTIVSTIIAIVSGTSIRKRTAEMIAISLAAAFITMLLGTVLKTYFGISI